MEAGASLPQLELDEPVRAIKQVSRDLDMKATLKLTGGRPTTAIAVQRAYLQAAKEFYACPRADDEIAKDVLIRWEECVEPVGAGPSFIGRGIWIGWPNAI